MPPSMEIPYHVEGKENMRSCNKLWIICSTLVGIHISSPAHAQQVTSIAVAPLSDGRLQLWAGTTAGQLLTTFKQTTDPNAGWSAWSNFGPGGVPIAGTITSLAVAPLEDGRLQLWAGTTAGQLLTTFKQTTDPNAGWSAWSNFGPGGVPIAGTITSLAVAPLEDGRLQLWAGTTAGQLLTTFKQTTDPNAGWSAWNDWLGLQAGGFSISASDALIERGLTGTIPVSLSVTPPFSSMVAITLHNPPTGVSAAALSITPPQSSGNLSVTPGAAAKFGKQNLTIQGDATVGGNTLSSPKTITLTVGRQSGAFKEANPSPYLFSAGNASLAIGFTVEVKQTGSSTFSATFKRGSTTVSTIDYSTGTTSNLGGAGFCDNSSSRAVTQGVVMTGPDGTSSQNGFTILDMTVSNPPPRHVPVNMTVTTMGGQLYSFQPRIFFSPDCTIAMIADANISGILTNRIELLDLASGRSIGEVPFATNIFSATIQNSGVGQNVVVSVDTGASTQSTQSFPIP